ncbi:Maf family protein [Chromatium okenii]|jgi:MAF protein|uniref:7-methyl-GTP pyrophosphatase n=1 Tax=Chromatium okenii TaxID=61644 RepID=A0A2S7XMM3_9GAMM|nr:Maf family protein [Chromatium okenii]MBV5309893.1 septum formation inhibitor Maf [Chromatium okenii]PQJ94984.1 septum formation inhibitor Maf [Chromatium okenii]
MSASVSLLPPSQPLILASTSPYRRELLARLGLAFTAVAPQVDETRQSNETATALVLRLAEAKARAVAAQFPDALIIGSDQVAVLDDAVLGKPHDRDTAIRQLEAASGRSVLFQNGLCLLNAATGEAQTLVEPFRVHFRTLTRQHIERYLDREQPYDCAGSFKSEGLGITLFARLEGDDPNALIGLPLIRLTALLEAANCDPLGA